MGKILKRIGKFFGDWLKVYSIGICVLLAFVSVVSFTIWELPTPQQFCFMVRAVISISFIIIIILNTIDWVNGD